MIGKSPRLRRDLALLATGALVAALFISPAGAHVGGTVGHLWKKHLAPLAKKVFFTKSQSDERFVNQGDSASDSEKLDGLDSTYFPAPAVGQAVEDLPGDFGSIFPPGAVFNNGSMNDGPDDPSEHDRCHWHNFDAEHTSAGYELDGDGMVNLYGVVIAVDGDFAGCDVNAGRDVRILGLPAEARPAKRAVFSALANNALVRINVNIDGSVSLESLDGSQTAMDNAEAWLSLDGIQFPAAPPGT